MKLKSCLLAGVIFVTSFTSVSCVSRVEPIVDRADAEVDSVIRLARKLNDTELKALIAALGTGDIGAYLRLENPAHRQAIACLIVNECANALIAQSGGQLSPQQIDALTELVRVSKLEN